MEENPYATPRSDSSTPKTRPVTGWVGRLFEVRYWPLAAVACFVLASIITPADPLSPVLAACPLFAAYLLIVCLKAWLDRNK